jgi:hypothetical protein
MAAKKEDRPKDAEHIHYHGIPFAEEEAALADGGPKALTNRRKVTPELLALGSTLMLLIGVLIIYFGYRLIRREREAWTMTMLLLVFLLIAGIMQGTFTSISTTMVVIGLLIYLWLRRNLFTVTTRYAFGPRQPSTSHSTPSPPWVRPRTRQPPRCPSGSQSGSW